MKNGWAWSTIGECCELTSGGTPSNRNASFWIGDVPFVSARDLKSDRIETASLHISREAVNQSATKVAPVGSILMLVRGMGLANGIQIGEVTVPVAFNQDYLAVFFNSSLGKQLVAGRLVGAAQKHFNVTAAKQVAISFGSVLILC